jgi:hypothetical protein
MLCIYLGGARVRRIGTCHVCAFTSALGSPISSKLVSRKMLIAILRNKVYACAFRSGCCAGPVVKAKELPTI